MCTLFTWESNALLAQATFFQLSCFGGSRHSRLAWHSQTDEVMLPRYGCWFSTSSRRQWVEPPVSSRLKKSGQGCLGQSLKVGTCRSYVVVTAGACCHVG